MHSEWGTPLNWAAKFEQVEVAKFLCRMYPESIFAPNASGVRPIYLAMIGNSFGGMKFLFAIDSSDVVISVYGDMEYSKITIRNANSTLFSHLKRSVLLNVIPTEEEILQYRAEVYFGSLLERLLF